MQQKSRSSGIVPGNGSTSSSPSPQNYDISLPDQQRFYANSAPSSTVTLTQSPQSRPPVPLFSNNSTGNLAQQNMASAVANSSHLEDLSSTMFDFDDYPASASETPYDEHLDFSAFESVNTPAPAQASDVKTVSPKDLMVDSMSAPPSGAFTELTTPGTSSFESPYQVHSSETSPMFNDEPYDDNPDHWPSLFEPMPESPAPQEPAAHYTESPRPMHAAPRMSRNDSSPGTGAQSFSSRSSHQGHRHSSVSGVTPRRGRDKPLPPIAVDENDMVAVKRARNTLAARKSREKRMEKMEGLAEENERLKGEIERWKGIAQQCGYVE